MADQTETEEQVETDTDKETKEQADASVIEHEEKLDDNSRETLKVQSETTQTTHGHSDSPTKDKADPGGTPDTSDDLPYAMTKQTLIGLMIVYFSVFLDMMYVK